MKVHCDADRLLEELTGDNAHVIRESWQTRAWTAGKMPGTTFFLYAA